MLKSREAGIRITRHRPHRYPLPHPTTAKSQPKAQLQMRHSSTHLEERLTGLADPLARIFIDILLADVGTPLLDNLFLEDVNLVERHQYFGDGRDERWVAHANESL